MQWLYNIRIVPPSGMEDALRELGDRRLSDAASELHFPPSSLNGVRGEGITPGIVNEIRQHFKGHGIVLTEGVEAGEEGGPLAFMIIAPLVSILKWMEGINQDDGELSLLTREIMEALDNFHRRSYPVAWPGGRIELSGRILIMGVVNVTPDSFSDAGLHMEPAAAREHALSMVEDGADIIDVGGESTRPGSEPVDAKEELRRVAPVIEALAGDLNVPISIDTTKAAVAEEAIRLGAGIVNDISGLRFDPRMPKVVARQGVPVVVSHTRGKPKVMQRNPIYRWLISEILSYLRESMRLGMEGGIAPEQFIVDPGIGFGKITAHNLEILRNLSQFKCLGRPILVGPSRKAFIGDILDLPPGERVEGTAAAVAASVMNGAAIVRAHDVREISRVVRVIDAIKSGSPDG